jgi:hypothetical protein
MASADPSWTAEMILKRLRGLERLERMMPTNGRVFRCLMVTEG